MKRMLCLPVALSAFALLVPAVPCPAAETDGRLALEWAAQFDELGRQITKERKWFQRVESTAYRPEALILKTDRDPADVVVRRTEALLNHLAGRLGAAGLGERRKQLEALKGRLATTPAADRPARRKLHDDVCRLRRRIAFGNPLLSFDRALFIKKHRARANHMCDQYFGFMAVPGGGLFVLEDPFGPSPTARDVLADAACENGRFKGRKLTGGAFLSPDLSYDGRTILFAYTEAEPTRFKWSPRSTWHVFRVNADGTHLRQLTDGKVNDFDPFWLPDGRVLFISERRGGFGRCHARPVPIFSLHTMNADGSDIRTVSLNESNEWHPSVDHNGMVVYTRWDYVDRGFNQAHHPWITTPDGRDARRSTATSSPTRAPPR